MDKMFDTVFKSEFDENTDQSLIFKTGKFLAIASNFINQEKLVSYIGGLNNVLELNEVNISSLIFLLRIYVGNSSISNVS
jgi:hypothetical protein